MVPVAVGQSKHKLDLERIVPSCSAVEATAVVAVEIEAREAAYHNRQGSGPHCKEKSDEPVSPAGVQHREGERPYPPP